MFTIKFAFVVIIISCAHGRPTCFPALNILSMQETFQCMNNTKANRWRRVSDSNSNNKSHSRRVKMRKIVRDITEISAA